MIQKLCLFIAAVLMLAIMIRFVVPVVIEKEMRRQKISCQTMQDRGYNVECR